jgi:hypothetical protein
VARTLYPNFALRYPIYQSYCIQTYDRRSRDRSRGIDTEVLHPIPIAVSICFRAIESCHSLLERSYVRPCTSPPPLLDRIYLIPHLPSVIPISTPSSPSCISCILQIASHLTTSLARQHPALHTITRRQRITSFTKRAITFDDSITISASALIQKFRTVSLTYKD